MTEQLPSNDWINSIMNYDYIITSLVKNTTQSFCVLLPDLRAIMVSQHKETKDSPLSVGIVFLPLLTTSTIFYPMEYYKQFFNDLLSWIGVINKTADDFSFDVSLANIRKDIYTPESTHLTDLKGVHGLRIADETGFLFNKIESAFEYPSTNFDGCLELEEKFFEEYFVIPDTPIVHKTNNNQYIVEFPKSVLVVDIVSTNNKHNLIFDCFIQENPNDKSRKRVLLTPWILVGILDNIYVKGALFSSNELGYTENGELFTTSDSKMFIAIKKRLHNINSRQFNKFKTLRQELDVEMHLAKKNANPFSQLGSLRGKLKTKK